MPAVNLNNGLLQSIQRLGEKYDVEKIVLFGSRARGNNQHISDIDIAVYPSPEFASEGKLASDFDDLDTLLKIDIVFINDDTDHGFIDNIEREGVILYECLS